MKRNVSTFSNQKRKVRNLHIKEPIKITWHAILNEMDCGRNEKFVSIITAGSLWAEYQMVSVNHFGWFNNTRFMFMMKRMSYGWPPTVVSHDLLAAFWYRGLNAHYKIYTLYKYLKENETGGYLIFLWVRKHLLK